MSVTVMVVEPSSLDIVTVPSPFTVMVVSPVSRSNPFVPSGAVTIAPGWDDSGVVPSGLVPVFVISSTVSWTVFPPVSFVASVIGFVFPGMSNGGIFIS